MKIYRIYLLYFFFILHLNILLSQEFDAFGRVNYAWKTSYSEVINHLQEQKIQYRVRTYSGYPTLANLVEYRKVPHQPYQPMVLKGYTFYNDSLIRIMVNIKEPDDKKRMDIYNWVKQILTEMYKHTPKDTLVHENSDNEALGCSWEFDATRIFLIKALDVVAVQYIPKKMTQEVQNALIGRARTDY